MCKNVMFTGGIPADSVEGVFELLATTVGERAAFWPDGEINPERRGWVGAINLEVLAKAPCFEHIPLPPGLPDSYVFKTLKIRDGAEVDLRGRLPYAKDAIASYRIFKRMQEAGKIPQGTRFQCSIPGAHDVISFTFPDVETWPVLFAAWQEAVRDECRKILEVIPAEELCIQIDYCTELMHIGGSWASRYAWMPDLSSHELLAQYTAPEYILPHLDGLPDSVTVGFHICCGTYPKYPTQALDDIALPVEISNAIQATTGGRVDYFHLPAMIESDEAYFAPLARLNIGKAKAYLGLECNDGIEGMTRRIKAARKYLADFGVAHYCGYLWNQPIMHGLLQTLAEGADTLSAEQESVAAL